MLFLCFCERKDVYHCLRGEEGPEIIRLSRGNPFPRQNLEKRRKAKQVASDAMPCRSDLNSLPARGQQIRLFQVGVNDNGCFVWASGTDKAQREVVLQKRGRKKLNVSDLLQFS
ncbi:hypothetical protein ccbrp13_34120 [Ktedonobacteria bacterium brp13]|nr:hypothetical protein ccbrp13_34120 [Ktedonobacteria bacterium brp13]